MLTFPLCLQAAVGIAYVVDSMRIFLYRGSQANTWALRSFLFIPIFIQGWLNSTSILVSYVSLATAQGNLHWKPVVVNTVLVGTGVALLLLEAVSSCARYRDAQRSRIDNILLLTHRALGSGRRSSDRSSGQATSSYTQGWKKRAPTLPARPTSPSCSKFRICLPTS